MTTERNYADLVSQAEKAVAEVKDPELKRVAFQKVLDDLLAVPDTQEHEPPLAKPKRKTARRTTQGAPKGKGGPQTYVSEMISDGFFEKPKTMAEVKAELENRGYHIPFTSLSGPLRRLTQQRKLRRSKSKASGDKETFSYSKW